MYALIYDEFDPAKREKKVISVHKTRETAEKAQSISKALRIIEGLQLNLDREKGGDIAANLDALYDYSTQTLLRANAEDSPKLLEEVVKLMNEIKSAWDEIAEAK